LRSIKSGRPIILELFRHPALALSSSSPTLHSTSFVKVARSAAMFTARRKIQKEKGQEPDEFEESVAQALFDLETTNQELKSDLRDLFINSAKYDDTLSSVGNLFEFLVTGRL
jgi:hypothetical protein